MEYIALQEQKFIKQSHMMQRNHNKSYLYTPTVCDVQQWTDVKNLKHSIIYIELSNVTKFTLKQRYSTSIVFTICLQKL